jgi:hypothetical protein
MNFSFSDVKTSVDRSTFFDKHLLVLNSENTPVNMLEQVE